MLLGSPLSTYKIKIDYSYFPPHLEKKYFYDTSGKAITEVSFTKYDLIYDIITCGMPSFWIRSRKHASERLSEVNYKLYLVETALTVDSYGYIIISDNLKHLDKSEKSFISYYLGMFMTKLLSRRIFGLDYLVHLGIVSQYKKVIRASSEPDLVGFCDKNDDYYLFESKGRSQVKASLVSSAKNQLKSIVSIAGNAPKLGVVCIAHPVEIGRQLKCSLYDPIPKKESKFNISKNELLYLYYLPIYELIKATNNENASYNIFLQNIDDTNTQIKLKIPQKLYYYFSECPTDDAKDDYLKSFSEILNQLEPFSEEKKLPKEAIINKYVSLTIE